MNDSRGFQDIESICSGKLTHIPSQPAVVPSLCVMLSRDQSMPPDTGNFVSDTGKRFWQATCNVRFDESKCHRWNPNAQEYRETCRER